MDSHSLVCQRCRQPLRLDDSLSTVGQGTYDMLSSTVPAHPQPPLLDTAASKIQLPSYYANSASSPGAPLSRRLVEPPSRRPNANPAESFIHVPSTPSSTTTHTPISHKLQLFSLLSGRTEIDHPLCVDCASVLLEALSRQFEDAKRERDAYIAFEQSAKALEKDEGSEEDALKRIEMLKEEHRGVDELKRLELERDELDAELAELEQQEAALALEEAQFLRLHSSQILAAQQQASELASVRTAHAHAAADLSKLERANVWADAFAIGHEGGVGTICGLRLGRGEGVEWAEVNAAWGQTALLLYSVAKKVGLEFQGARLVPLGSFSRVEKAPTQGGSGRWEPLELYHPGSALSVLHTRRFDQAMILFLDLLRQAMDFASARDPSIRWPHRISKDRIGDHSVRLPGQFAGGAGEEGWTRAMRHLLGNCKMLVGWSTRE